MPVHPVAGDDRVTDVALVLLAERLALVLVLVPDVERVEVLLVCVVVVSRVLTAIARAVLVEKLTTCSCQEVDHVFLSEMLSTCYEGGGWS